MAFDSSGVKTPDRMQFMRKSRFAIYRKITANENFYFLKRTELEMVVGPDGGRHLIYKKKIIPVFHWNDCNYFDMNI